MTINQNWQDVYLKASNGLSLTSDEDKILQALCKVSGLNKGQLSVKAKIHINKVLPAISSLNQKLMGFSIDFTGIVQREYFLK